MTTTCSGLEQEHGGPQLILAMSDNREGHYVSAAFAGRGGGRAIPKGRCPNCNESLIGASGKEIYQWAHQGDPCDPWQKEDTVWAYDWKMAFESNGFAIEKIINKRFCDGFIEPITLILQSGAITLEEVAAKEAHFGENMAWLWDARTWIKEQRGNQYLFDRPRKGLLVLKRPVFLHTSPDLIKVQTVTASANGVLGKSTTLATAFLAPPVRPKDPLGPKGGKRKSLKG